MHTVAIGISLMLTVILLVVGCATKTPEPEFKDEFNDVPSAKVMSDITDAGPEPQPSAKVLKKYFGTPKKKPLKKAVVKPKKKKKKVVADESK